MKPKEYTPEQLKWKAEAYCAAAERCEYDVLQKLVRWKATPETQAAILAHLYKENYLSTERYCRAFVRDKYRLAHWGTNKIVQALRLKQLPAEDIRAALEEIETDEYDEILVRLLQQKRKSIKAKNDYEMNTKLIRFALGRGYQMKEILKYIHYDENEQFTD